jgi:hypothetical protein
MANDTLNNTNPLLNRNEHLVFIALHMLNIISDAQKKLPGQNSFVRDILRQRTFNELAALKDSFERLNRSTDNREVI